MEWAKYRELCDSPNVFSRWALEQTKLQVDPDLRRVFDQILISQYVEKPSDHKGDERTDMFVLELDRTAIREIIECLQSAESSNKKTRGSVVRGFDGLIKAWEEYLAKHPSQ